MEETYQDVVCGQLRDGKWFNLYLYKSEIMKQNLFFLAGIPVIDVLFCLRAILKRGSYTNAMLLTISQQI